MNIYGMLFLIVVASIFAFAIGRKFPTGEKLEEIKKIGVREATGCWFQDTEWNCIRVFEDNTGPFGMSLEQIVLENKRGRLTLCRRRDDIHEGTRVRLKMRPNGSTAGVSIGLIDELMLPEPV